MEKLALISIFGTQPWTIKMSAISKKCNYYSDYIMMHTFQNQDHT